MLLEKELQAPNTWNDIWSFFYWILKIEKPLILILILKGARIGENGKEDNIVNMMNVDKNCMEINVIHKKEIMVCDNISYENEELITYFLDKKFIDQHFLNQNVYDVDFFLYHPQQHSGTMLSLSLSLCLLYSGSKVILWTICF